MTRYRRILSKLESHFTPLHLELINESERHHVPTGSESHFKVIIVSDAFAGLSRLQRHQAIYNALSDEMNTGLHALSISAQTAAEWQQAPASLKTPPCRGGSLS
jgi:stress-induced morphogen